MHRLCSIGLATVFALVAAGAVGCGANSDEPQRAGDPQELAWLRETRQQLEQERRELSELRQQQREAPASAATTPAAETATEEPVAERIEALEERIADRSEEFGGRLVSYINSLEIPPDEPLTEEQQEAIRMKSDEDMAIAQEWIERGGDYRRALEIYESALLWDPDYQELQQARDQAQSMRFMTEERFEQVKKGMTQSEVRELLGPVNLHNVREYPERKASAWFYPKEGGGAAGVYFRLDERRGSYLVYQTDFAITGG